MTTSSEVLLPTFGLEDAVAQTVARGYFFSEYGLVPTVNDTLAAEIGRIPLEYGDHVNKPINARTAHEVRQEHERFYVAYGNSHTPAANLVIEGLSQAVQSLASHPELGNWQPTEIGYQRYSQAGFIGIHKDRASDQLLSVTFTLTGSAPVEVYKTIDDPNDYSEGNVELIDRFVTTPGSLMMLRAPGLGNGEQVPHKVLHPTIVPRSILNLRIRDTILKQPTES